MDHYKAEHSRLLKEDMTLLELAIWKAKLDDFMAPSIEVQPTKKTKLDVDEIRREHCITSGASIIIKNTNNSHQTYIAQTNVPDPLPTQHSPLSSLFCCSTSSSEEEAKPQSIDSMKLCVGGLWLVGSKSSKAAGCVARVVFGASTASSLSMHAGNNRSNEKDKPSKYVDLCMRSLVLENIIITLDDIHTNHGDKDPYRRRQSCNDEINSATPLPPSSGGAGDEEDLGAL
eukprot:scaffold3797_cov91-Skeletonema_dohrnii-CCMP3373.AAC.10